MNRFTALRNHIPRGFPHPCRRALVPPLAPPPPPKTSQLTSSRGAGNSGRALRIEKGKVSLADKLIWGEFGSVRRERVTEDY